MLTSTGGSGLVSYVRQILGTYTPTGDYIANIDYEYIICGIILIMFIHFSLKILYSLVK